MNLVVTTKSNFSITIENPDNTTIVHDSLVILTKDINYAIPVENISHISESGGNKQDLIGLLGFIKKGNKKDETAN